MAAATERDGIRPKDNFSALPLVAPFVVVYAVMFIYPTILMVAMSFTDSSLTVAGKWVGWDNYGKLLTDRRFGVAISNTRRVGAWCTVRRRASANRSSMKASGSAMSSGGWASSDSSSGSVARSIIALKRSALSLKCQ